MMKQKSGNILIVLLLIVVVIAFGVLGTVMYFGLSNDQSGNVSRITTTLSPSPMPKSANLITPTESYCDCAWAISGTTNVEFLVTSPSGRKQGYLQNTNTYVYDIPDATYGIEGGIADATGQGPPTTTFTYFGMNNPDNGIYDLQIIAKQSGGYHLEISFAWGPGNTRKASFDGILDLGQVDKYTVTIPDGTVRKSDN